MFENPEIKGLRQDVDLLSQQISDLVETLESRHAEVMTRLELIEEKIDAGFSEDIDPSAIEEIRDNTEEIRNTIEEVTEAIQEIAKPKQE